MEDYFGHIKLCDGGGLGRAPPPDAGQGGGEDQDGGEDTGNLHPGLLRITGTVNPLVLPMTTEPYRRQFHFHVVPR